MSGPRDTNPLNCQTVMGLGPSSFFSPGFGKGVR